MPPMASQYYPLQPGSSFVHLVVFFVCLFVFVVVVVVSGFTNKPHFNHLALFNPQDQVHSFYLKGFKKNLFHLSFCNPRADFPYIPPQWPVQWFFTYLKTALVASKGFSFLSLSPVASSLLLGHSLSWLHFARCRPVRHHPPAPCG